MHVCMHACSVGGARYNNGAVVNMYTLGIEEKERRRKTLHTFPSPTLAPRSRGPLLVAEEGQKQTQGYIAKIRVDIQ